MKGDCNSAFCLACDSKFKVDNGGISQLQRHEETKRHNKKRILEYNQSRTIVTNQVYEISLSTNKIIKDHEEQVLTAEVLQALNIIDKKQSFQSADGDNECFQMMFPDSGVAKSYKQGKTKVNYMVQYDIAPFMKALLNGGN